MSTDGIQNQDETGVDCGGSTCPACPSCSDGIQNQDETGIDCGGTICPDCPNCSDGIQNQDETGIDCGGTICAPCGVNTPPVADILVTPGVGWHDTASRTVFAGDATASWDLEDSPGALTYDWDWDGDGTFDASGPTPSGDTYSAAGSYEVVLRVTDTGGLRDYATFLVVVRSRTNVLTVTTAVDENDAGATPSSPGGTGFSLREALLYANSQTGAQSILVPAGMVINLTSVLPDSTDASGVGVIADGAIIDGSGAGGRCVFITRDKTRYLGVEIRACSASPYSTQGNGNLLSRAYIHDNLQDVLLDGDDNVVSHSEIANNGSEGLESRGNNLIAWNRIHGHTSRAIFLPGAADGTRIIGNTIHDNGRGIHLSNGANGIVMLHNTIAFNTQDGIQVGNNVSGAVL